MSAWRGWLPYVGAGLAAGVLSGLFGIGGGLIIVPILVFLFHYRQKLAQGTSLAAIVIIALAAAVPYVLHVHIDWLAAGLIVIGGVIGSMIGTAIANRLEDDWLRVIFVVVAIASAVKMVLGVSSSGGALSVSPAHSVAIAAAYLGSGLAMGILSAMIGVGGGIILVPLLTLLLGLAQPEAQGLSLVVVMPVSLVGAFRHARVGNADLRAGLALGIGGAVISPLAAIAALHLPIRWLSILFAVLLVFTAGQLLQRVIASRRALSRQTDAARPARN